MNTKRVLVAAFAVVVVVVGALSASMMLANASYNPHDGEKWRTDVSEASQLAQSEGSPVLVYVWMDGCSGCEQFNGQLQNDGKLQGAVDKYVLVSTKLGENPTLTQPYGVTSTPTVVVIGTEGEMVAKFHPTQVDTASKLNQVYETATQ
jgi:thioredoxin-like negative regulator of GroEL